ncbi:MAG: amidohydrolase [Nitrososphaerota archaeon]|nr:amidohydrolase [Nitrososphaerota archaeon]
MSRLLIRGCTLWDSSPGSVYCEDGRVARITRGGDPEVPPGTDVVEGNGGSLVPGLVDTHCHPFDYGWLKRGVDLREAGNITGVRMRVSSGVMKARPGEWVFGYGWDHERFPGKALPTRADIDDLSPANPVALSRICGHIGVLNSAAIGKLGIEGKGGPEYERDSSGALTGIVKEEALTRALQEIPKDPERLASDLMNVESEAARLGLTGLHCIVSPEGYREELTALSGLLAGGSLSVRYRVYVPPEALEFVKAEGLREKMRGPMARLNGVKIFTDGSLGARTAALREPYTDDPGNSGLLRMKDEELADVVERVDSMGLQAIVHAIGDRAVEQAVDALSRVAGSRNPLRHRIEHAGLAPRDLRSKMAKHGIRAAVQPSFVTSDTWAVDRVGKERLRDLYPIRSFLDEGIVASGGSDSPVESLNPVLGIWSAVTRGGIVPEESIPLPKALELYTGLAASNGFDVTALEEGGPADFTLFDADVTGMHPALFRKVGVLATVVGGVPVHSFGVP